MLCVHVTFSVLKLLTSTLFRLVQNSNMLVMLVTLRVSKLLRSSSVRLLQPANIVLISVTLRVSKWLRSRFLAAQPLNMANMSSTSLVLMYSSPFISLTFRLANHSLVEVGRAVAIDGSTTAALMLR